LEKVNAHKLGGQDPKMRNVMNKKETYKSDRIFNVDYKRDPFDDRLFDHKETSNVLAKVIFAWFNIVFLVILGVILVSYFGM
jgi:hypothetical protein